MAIALSPTLKVACACPQTVLPLAAVTVTRSPSISLTTASIKFDSPRKSAAKTVFGRKYKSCGVPICSIFALFIRQMRSDITIASS